MDFPGHFAVMWRPELLDPQQGAYRQAHDAAFGVLVDGARRARPDLDPDDPEVLLAATGAWSIVHGFAVLWLEGNLPEDLTRLPLEDAALGALGAFGAMVAGAPAPPAGRIG